MQRRPVTMWDVIDESERYLDERGLERPHLAGHSMGGFIALELARRGRAASVCVFSPGGLWSDDLRVQVAKRLRRQFALGRLMRPITPFLLKSPVDDKWLRWGDHRRRKRVRSPAAQRCGQP